MPYNLQAPTRSFYIHWPFCPYRCHFCPFVTVQNQDHLMEQYHHSLVREMEQYFSKAPVHQPLRSIYFGGGTPSTYPNELLLDMGGILKERVQWDDNIEITLEVNPGTVTPDQFPIWQQVGINRLSIGVQSLNDKVLKNLNRHQTVADVEWLLEEAAPYFDALSVDLIVGLPGISDQEWRAMMARIVQWPIKHCSMYFLSIHEGTPLYFRLHKKKDIVLPVDDAVVDLYQWSVEYLRRHGFEQYEVSNFARPGYRSVHNQMYWEHKPYKGFGLGACSFDGDRRLQNEKSIIQYLKHGESGSDLTIFEETLSDDQRWFEQFMLGMRRPTGVSVDEIVAQVAPARRAGVHSRLSRLVERDLVSVQSGQVALTTAGLAMENEVVVQLMMEQN